MKEAEKSKIYVDLMQYLTFLDYTHIEATSRSQDARLIAANKRIAELERDIKMTNDALVERADMYQQMNDRLEKLERSQRHTN